MIYFCYTYRFYFAFKHPVLSMTHCSEQLFPYNNLKMFTKLSQISLLAILTDLFRSPTSHTVRDTLLLTTVSTLKPENINKTNITSQNKYAWLAVIYSLFISIIILLISKAMITVDTFELYIFLK